MPEQEMWEFIVYGIPVPWARPRAARMPHGIRFFEADKVTVWRNAVAMSSLPTRPKAPTTKAIAMTLTFWLPRPQSLPKRELWPITKPDIDNLAKAIQDALEGIYYRRDSQVVRLVVTKAYADTPGVRVLIEEVP